MKFANSAAKKLGKIASVRTFPIANTSNPNNVPAKGVPNTELKPALIPLIIKISRSALSNRNKRAVLSANAPPIWTAVPSRPTDPPNKWVVMVPNSVSGISRNGIFSSPPFP